MRNKREEYVLFLMFGLWKEGKWKEKCLYIYIYIYIILTMIKEKKAIKFLGENVTVWDI